MALLGQGARWDREGLESQIGSNLQLSNRPLET